MAKLEDLRNKVYGTLKEEEFQITKEDTKVIVDTVFNSVLDLLVEDGEVPMGDLGKLQVVERAARKGRNPADGTEIMIPSKNAAKFKPSKRIKEAVL